MRRSFSVWCGYVLIWTTKPSPLCRRFGVLFVESTRLGCVGSKTSPGHVYICTVSIIMSGQHSVMADQVVLWSDKVQAAIKKLFSSLQTHGLFTFFYFHLVTSIDLYFQREARNSE